MKITRILASVLALSLLAFTAAAQDKKGGKKGAGGAGDAAKGKEVFEQCAVCHNPDSEEKKMGPGMKGLFAKKTLADGKTEANEKNIRLKIDQGGNGMPAYEEMLDKKEKDNLIAYLKTL